MEKIYLIGFMASGKTTVGKILAEKLGWHFIDIDDVIEKRKGMSINEIFSIYGEKYFRELEKEVLLNFIPFEKVVVSVGGGLPVYFKNMELMLQTGFTVYLEVNEQVLIDRLKNKSELEKRPLVNKNSEENLLNILRERKNIYEKAHEIVKCNSRTPAEIAEEIIKSFLVWKKSQ